MSYMEERKKRQRYSGLISLLPDVETYIKVLDILGNLCPEIEIQFVQVTYQSWETEEELNVRKFQDDLTLQKDRQEYERLKEKFGDM